MTAMTGLSVKGSRYSTSGDAGPPDSVFDTACDVIKAGFAVLDPSEREERIERVIEACHKVAEASESQFAKLIGLETGVSKQEASMLDLIKAKLRSTS